MIECFSIPDLLNRRASQPSFHIVSEQHLRIEFRNMAKGDALERFAYGGDLVITCYTGTFALVGGDGEAALVPMTFAVVPSGTPLVVRCDTSGTVQLIWAPAHAETAKVAFERPPGRLP